MSEWIKVDLDGGYNTAPEGKGKLFEVIARDRMSEPHIITAEWSDIQNSFILNHPVVMPISNVQYYRVLSEQIPEDILYELRK